MKINILSKFLLLAHDPHKSRFLISEMHINYGIIGAAMLEMSVDEQIKIVDDKLILNDDKVSDNAVVSEIADEIWKSKKSRKLRYWMQKLTRNSRKYKWEIIANLAENKLIKIEEKKFLRVFPYRKTFLTENNARKELIEQLRGATLYGEILDNDMLILLGLVEACKMHKIIASDKVELKKLRRILKVIIKDSPIAETLSKTIQQVQAALIVVIL